MSTVPLPRMLAVRQLFPPTPPVHLRHQIERGMEQCTGRIQPGQQIAVAVGSRGISNLLEIVRAVVDALRARQAQPFVVPAMGSHGGATPEGQVQLLAEYGITEAALQAPIRAAMEVEQIGVSDDGVEVVFSAEACRADGVVVINRIKPHTDFSGAIGSGLLKMMVVGLGKRVGAAQFHVAASRLGYERVIRGSAQVILRSGRILAGVAILENQRHETAHVEVVPPGDFVDGEARLFSEAARLMPRLPFDQIDLLIVDRLGKNISGAGMDPNVVGRGVHGYSSMLGAHADVHPNIHRLYVRDLTPESHGNAIGIGMADATTTRLVRGIDSRVTALNALTALTVQSAKVPIAFETDREAITRLIESLASRDPAQAKVVRIADTLSLEDLHISESFLPLLDSRTDLNRITAPSEIEFDQDGNLPALA